MLRTTNGFDRSSEPVFIKTLNTITGKMNGNANFPQQKAMVDQLILDKNEFLVLSKNAVKGGTQAMLLRNNKRAEIVTALHNLGNVVTAVAAGSESMIESSGFPYTKPRQPTPPLVKPVAPFVRAGEGKGQIFCKAKRQGDCLINFMICADKPGAVWEVIPSTRVTCLFSDLTSAQIYLIKYELVGVRGQRVMSDIVSYVSQ